MFMTFRVPTKFTVFCSIKSFIFKWSISNLCLERWHKIRSLVARVRINLLVFFFFHFMQSVCNVPILFVIQHVMVSRISGEKYMHLTCLSSVVCFYYVRKINIKKIAAQFLNWNLKYFKKTALNFLLITKMFFYILYKHYQILFLSLHYYIMGTIYCDVFLVYVF